MPDERPNWEEQASLKSHHRQIIKNLEAIRGASGDDLPQAINALFLHCVNQALLHFNSPSEDYKGDNRKYLSYFHKFHRLMVSQPDAAAIERINRRIVSEALGNTTEDTTPLIDVEKSSQNTWTLGNPAPERNSPLNEIRAMFINRLLNREGLEDQATESKPFIQVDEESLKSGIRNMTTWFILAIRLGIGSNVAFKERAAAGRG